MGINQHIHSYVTFTFPKFRARRYLGKDGMGHYPKLSLNNDSNNPSTCRVDSPIRPRSDSTGANYHDIDINHISLYRTTLYYDQPMFDILFPNY